MPKYDYKCSHCDEVTELEHAMTDDYNYLTCQDCGMGTIMKSFSAPATHFKGQGWGAVYRTHKPKENNG